MIRLEELPMNRLLGEGFVKITVPPAVKEFLDNFYVITAKDEYSYVIVYPYIFRSNQSFGDDEVEVTCNDKNCPKIARDYIEAINLTFNG